MPRGFHYCRNKNRTYTDQYYRISAKAFKSLLIAPLGSYSLNGEHITNEHKTLNLSELDNGVRLITFNINEQPHRIVLRLDNRSASNKLYITCPYCQEQRQHLYAIKKAYVCRKCIGLHYASQSERPHIRLARKIRKHRKELWGSDWPEINNLFKHIEAWPKPKWMRWKTFERKRNKIIELESKFWPVAVNRFESAFNFNLRDKKQK